MDGTRARAVLGVTELATHKELRNAFRTQAKRTHPDAGGDAEKFRLALLALAALQQPTGTAPTDVAKLQLPRRFMISLPSTDLRRTSLDVYDCAPTSRPQRARSRVHRDQERLDFGQFLAGAIAQRAAA